MTEQTTKPVLLVRANGNSADAVALAELGLKSVVDPYIKISAVDGPAPAKRLLEHLDAADWLIATSLNGIKFWRQLVGHEVLAQAIQSHALLGLRFAAIGAATAKALGELGAQDILVPEVATSQDLVQLVLREAGRSPLRGLADSRVAVLPAGNLAMQTLIDELTANSWTVRSEVVYKTEPVSHQPDSAPLAVAGQFSALLLRSPSAARAFARYAGDSEVPVVCGGATTARVARELGLNVAAVSASPSSHHSAQAIFEVVQANQDLGDN